MKKLMEEKDETTVFQVIKMPVMMILKMKRKMILTIVM